MEKLTIIVPVYNPPIDMFKRAITSYASQEVPIMLEVLLVDDGSNKETKEEIQKLKAQFSDVIKVVEKENHGVAAARNTGLDNFDGNYLALMDQDDYLEHGAMNKVISEFHNDNSIDMIQYGYKEKFSTDRGVDRTTNNKKFIVNSTEYANEYINGYLWCKVYKIEDKRIIPRFRENFQHYDDKLWIIAFLKNIEKILFIPDIFYTWEYNPKSLSRDKEKIIDIQKKQYLGLEEVIRQIRPFGKIATEKQVELYLYRLLMDYCFWKFDFKEDKKEKNEQTKIRANLIKKIMMIIPRKEIRSKYTKNNLYLLFLLLHPFTKRTRKPLYINTDIDIAKDVFEIQN